MPNGPYGNGKGQTANGKQQTAGMLGGGLERLRGSLPVCSLPVWRGGVGLADREGARHRVWVDVAAEEVGAGRRRVEAVVGDDGSDFDIAREN